MALLFLPCTTALAQTALSKDAKTLDVRPDNGAPAPVKLLANTLVQRIAPGQTSTTIVVSSTKGSEADKLTAIVIVANADQWTRIASTASPQGGTLVFGSGDSGGLSVLGLQ